MDISFTNQLPQGILAEFEEQVWKILVDDTYPLLVVQTRNGEAYQTSFAAIDIQNNQVLWQNFILDESWWLGMAGLHDRVLFLYTYPDAQKPQSQGIIAVDIDTQQVLWQTQNINFYQIEQGKIWGLSVENTNKKYCLLEPRTGKILDKFREFSPLEVRKNENNRALFPFHYYNEMAYFQTVAIFLKKKI